MALVRASRPRQIRLAKDLTRFIKRGHCWLYSHAIEAINAPAGSVALIVDRRDEKPVAAGIYDASHPIPLRVCRTQPPYELDDQWCAQRLENCVSLRSSTFDEQTSGYRLVAGEGDGLPGLIVDVYADVAVLKLDGGAPTSFYEPSGLARWLVDHLPVSTVIQRSRQRGRAGEVLLGDLATAPIRFLEHGMQFTADVIHGQKTGFFLDQRDNRALIRQLAAGQRVLNLFSFSGGFSIAAGIGGAVHVDSVDSAPLAIEAARTHWQQNELPPDCHRAVTSDCFDFLETAAGNRQTWDIVVCDPPSFAPSEKAVPRALAAYRRLAQLAARVTRPGGLLALASCSSHVDRTQFLESNLESLGRARRKATLLADRGLPLDHPTPLAMPELRYLKFLLFQLD